MNGQLEHSADAAPGETGAKKHEIKHNDALD
jgi:hypothetical protein